MRKFDDSLPLQLLKAREAAMSFFRPLLQEYAVTEQQWRILRALDEYQELESKQLAERCCILSPSLTGILNRLEQVGYIQRRKSSEDQRRSCISLSEQGRQLVDTLSPQVEQRYKQLTDSLSQQKLEQLSTLLHELSQLRSL
ncbi:homoprotocatechuate degradation operon regulator HpaR [Marinobacterium arenosum]|uniref:homoprotocatechuate degradation operon regulator HpaR n=1 Tax=Marinobacterium arenosum TaxID=2862496 RepID=UPI001C93C05D|nr:homoprotocatechuate degradation operon regulator HpaR [Marinobacterium arenosum]MBY4675373.1 homoprotocatechuate degradation operon regulator HpaR [Marinobacterium arenosum]